MIRPIFSGLVILAFATAAAYAQQAADKPAAAPTQEQLEQQFSDTLSGATLVGNFTVTGVDNDKPLKTDRYTLGKVSKINSDSGVRNDLWSFETRIQYGDHDVKLPLALQVKWAGDTPVITLTDVGIPGLGTFTARVLVYRGQYVGTWQHGDHGGAMFGKIIKAGDKQDADKAAQAGSAK
jgi:hypothetical protein